MVGRVCVIGAGPSGLSVLWWFSKLQREGKSIPELVCYEKQSNWGGLWNFTWRTGLDQHGEPVHGSQYRYLWSNSPKECLEFPNYTFEDHFGKAIPSFPPRDVLVDYLNGKWNKEDIRKYIRFNTVVRDVCYNQETNDFTVLVKDLATDKVLDAETFDNVIVATGHFSVPNVPSFEGIDKFPGRVMHSHDFREASEFAGKRVMCIGSHYSAEDIAMQCIKYGAQSIICTWRTKPMGFKWPSQICERPLVQRFQGKTAFFKDGTEAEVDVVILCTGYLHSYPFLREELRLKSKNLLYPPNMYKGIVWQEGGNNKLMYVGVQDQYYSYTLFDICALWAVKCVLGDIALPDKETMDKDWRSWVARNETCQNYRDDIKFQTDYVMDLTADCGSDYPYNLDCADMFVTWEQHKEQDVTTYRDQAFASKYTGTMSPVHHTTWMKAYDDSLNTYVNKTL